MISMSYTSMVCPKSQSLVLKVVFLPEFCQRELSPRSEVDELVEVQGAPT